MSKVERYACDGGCGREIADPAVIHGWITLKGSITRAIPGTESSWIVQYIPSGDFCSVLCIGRALERSRQSPPGTATADTLSPTAPPEAKVETHTPSLMSRLKDE